MGAGASQLQTSQSPAEAITGVPFFRKARSSALILGVRNPSFVRETLWLWGPYNKDPTISGYYIRVPLFSETPTSESVLL